MLDSSHITHGVLTVGVRRGDWTVDTSLFRGRDLTIKDTVYGRAELVDRFILVDFEYAAATGLDRHLPSSVAALTVAYERGLVARKHVAFALGADVTLHHLSANLRDSYGRPMSWHVFLRASAR